MATSTTRLGLRLPAGSDRVNVALDISDNFTAMDTNINAQVVTSGTRPSSPFTGKLIYETDTDTVLIWNGTAWKKVGNNSWGKGFMATTAIEANSANTSGTTELDTGFEVSFTAEIGRKYMVETQFTGTMTTDDATAGGAFSVKYRYAAGAAVTTAGTEISGGVDFVTLTVNNTSTHFHGWRLWDPNTTGQVTVGLFLVGVASHVFRITGNATTTRGSITVLDVGAV